MLSCVLVSTNKTSELINISTNAQVIDAHVLNDVIIIDQPEDDLDNQTIYDDVIKLVREMKPYTQFILATHNANFPVLGDAEQVHACRYQDDLVQVQSGSIDARPVQNAIINIMEGGEEAFNRRKEVYNLWKPQNSSK
jgi:hypothetical protein